MLLATAILLNGLFGCAGSTTPRQSLGELRQEQVALTSEQEELWQQIKGQLWGPTAETASAEHVSLHDAPPEVQELILRHKQVTKRLNEVARRIAEFEGERQRQEASRYQDQIRQMQTQPPVRR